MKKVGLIDVDGHNFPNLPLMKLSAWHKRKGDEVEWYEPFKRMRLRYTRSCREGATILYFGKRQHLKNTYTGNVKEKIWNTTNH